ATMVVAMLPLALKLTAGAESRASIGAVVAGGMLSSTLLSLVLVPVVYSTLDDLKQGSQGLRKRARSGAEQRPAPQPAAPPREPVAAQSTLQPSEDGRADMAV
ncbi:MAG: efflux RND transporter permease subunit, partial [Chloroflexota bacterium]|nr:efflux RND transporter permease subunit [Chloroflexota bacterium]